MLGRDAEIGMKVIFLGSIPEQVKWANADEPEHLETGGTYEIEDVRRSEWYTKIKLIEDPCWYNSVHFRKV